MTEQPHQAADSARENPASISNESTATDSRRWNEIPFTKHLHLPPIEMSSGTARLEMVVEEFHLRHGGLMHGGMLATLLDSVTGFAAYSVVKKSSDVLTMQLNLNMTATAKLGQRVIATAKVVHAGNRTAVVTAEIRLADGKLLATGSATMFIVEKIVT